jgi:hydrogenase maturation protein HypF
MKSYHIHIEGQVQGVGFRPFVLNKAKAFGLTGWVSNDVDGVHIEITGDEQVGRLFYHNVVVEAPAHARITQHHMHEIDLVQFPDFHIRPSTGHGIANLLITPDLAICSSCANEVRSAEDRRHGYAFTTCTHCGPRYSIIQSLPYDRVNTTMAPFVPCVACEREYDDSDNRRFFSQTNSCPDCSIYLSCTDASGELITDDPTEVVEKTVSALRLGKIVALKGVGGYLLLCDAANATAIQTLRVRKHRPTKPFALLYPDMDRVQHDTVLSEAEFMALQSPVAPIVILKSKACAHISLEDIAPGMDTVGVMLPYTPLMVLIMDQFKNPVVATSANESGSPIFYEDAQALEALAAVADYFVINNRDIVVPQDDSVMRFTRDDHPVILRRSRGMAPTLLPHPFVHENRSWLAMGSDMKSSFALLHRGNVYASQFLGDLENYQTQQSYIHTLSHVRSLVKATPQAILVDKHPAYFSSTRGRQLASKERIPVISVQHHVAHFSAVLAENNLLRAQEPVLGVVWDGTGWGDDGAVWGGEFFLYERGLFTRIEHLDYFPHLLADKISREPRLSALVCCKEIPEAESWLRSKFSATEWSVYHKILSQSYLLKSSSVGRLFDAVASLLGVCDRAHYEGEAALQLEALASRVADVPSDQIHTLVGHVTREKILRAVIEQRQAQVPVELIAYRFHGHLVQWISQVASRELVSQLAFSGGVFQNALLVHMTRTQLSASYTLHFHQQLSPNDENIGVGQLAYHYITQHVRGRLEEKRELVHA